MHWKARRMHITVTVLWIIHEEFHVFIDEYINFLAVTLFKSSLFVNKLTIHKYICTINMYLTEILVKILPCCRHLTEWHLTDNFFILFTFLFTILFTFLSTFLALHGTGFRLKIWQLYQIPVCLVIRMCLHFLQWLYIYCVLFIIKLTKLM